MIYYLLNICYLVGSPTSIFNITRSILVRHSNAKIKFFIIIWIFLNRIKIVYFLIFYCNEKVNFDMINEFLRCCCCRQKYDVIVLRENIITQNVYKIE